MLGPTLLLAELDPSQGPGSEFLRYVGSLQHSVLSWGLTYSRTIAPTLKNSGTWTRASPPRTVALSIPLPTRLHRRSLFCSSPAITVDFGPLTHQNKVKSVISTLSVDGPKTNLAKFTSFRTRCKHFSPCPIPPYPHLGIQDYRSDVSPRNGTSPDSFVISIADRKGKPTLVTEQDSRGTFPSENDPSEPA